MQFRSKVSPRGTRFRVGSGGRREARGFRTPRVLLAGLALAWLGACEGTGEILDGANPGANPAVNPGGASGDKGGFGTSDIPVGNGSGVAGGTISASCKPGTPPATTPARIWRLSDEQIHAAIADLIPGISVPDVTTTGRAKGEFINMSELFPVDGALAVDLRSAARAVAGEAVKTMSARLGCAAGQDERTCAQDYVQRFASRAFRRPLASDDKTALMTLFATGAATSTADGVRLVMEGVLQSPSFLYRTELGQGASKSGELPPHELATALSFFLLNSIPDEALWATALDGSLARQDVYDAQVKRLLDLPRVRANIGRIFLKWTGLGAGVTTELASEDYPLYDEPMKQSLSEEATRFFAGLVGQGGTVGDLMTSRKAFVDKRVAGLYGVPYTGSGDFVETTLPADQRSGILTLSSLIVAKSHGHAVVHRGKWIRKELFCQDIPSPPPGTNLMPPETLNLSEREFAAFRLGDATCGGCHKQMDPLGLAFEAYDALGRYATRDKAGKSIDTTGEITGTDVDGKVTGGVELAQKLAGSQQVRLCIEAKMYAYALGREVGGDADTCEVQRLDTQVAASGGRLLDMMAAVAGSSAFRVRNGGQ
jgi:hypothetical protein